MFQISILTFPLKDVDECGEDIDNCSQNCSDTLGSYQCICNDGYTLDSDEHTCNGLCLKFIKIVSYLAYLLYR